MLRSLGLPLLVLVPLGALLGLAVGWSSRGLVIGAVIALVLGTLDLVGFRGAGAGALVPRQAVDVPVRGGGDLPYRIQAALGTLPAEVRSADVPAGRYAARTRMSWRSWGEEVTVQLAGDPSAPTARIASRPVIRMTLLDYGRGRSNVARVAAALRG